VYGEVGISPSPPLLYTTASVFSFSLVTITLNSLPLTQSSTTWAHFPHLALASSLARSIAEGFPPVFLSCAAQGRLAFCSPGTGLPFGSSHASSLSPFPFLPCSTPKMLTLHPRLVPVLASCHGPFCIAYPSSQPTPFPRPPTCPCPLQPVAIPVPPVHLNHPTDSGTLSDTDSAVPCWQGMSSFLFFFPMLQLGPTIKKNLQKPPKVSGNRGIYWKCISLMF